MAAPSGAGDASPYTAVFISFNRRPALALRAAGADEFVETGSRTERASLKRPVLYITLPSS